MIISSPFFHILTFQPTKSNPTVSPTLSPVTSKPTSSPSASPISAPFPIEETQSPSSSTNLPSASPVPQEPTCLLITTGNGRYDNGYLDVLVDTGSGYVEVTTTGIKYTQDEIVLDECYSGLVGVQVTNTQTNAWAGRIETSILNKASPYSAMECINCTGEGSTTDYIVVDGDNNGKGQTECLGGIEGNVCTLVNVATRQPTPEVSDVYFFYPAVTQTKKSHQFSSHFNHLIIY